LTALELITFANDFWTSSSILEMFSYSCYLISFYLIMALRSSFFALLHSLVICSLIFFKLSISLWHSCLISDSFNIAYSLLNFAIFLSSFYLNADSNSTFTFLHCSLNSLTALAFYVRSFSTSSFFTLSIKCIYCCWRSFSAETVLNL
jgi:hypothetical protein